MDTPIDLLIFDLDGTLVDTREDLATAVNHALASLALQRLSTDQVMEYVGNGLYTLMQRSLGSAYSEKLPAAIASFREYYQEHMLDVSTLYPGVLEVLEHFREKKMAVISNKPEAFTVPMIAGLQLSPYFDLVLGGDSVPQMKPDPAPVKHVLSRLHVTPARAVMVGDGTTDIQAGKGAGIHTCGVTYGYRSAEVLLAEAPDYLLAGIAELIGHFE
jgi:phosphoglycolate phosphatase